MCLVTSGGVLSPCCCWSERPAGWWSPARPGSASTCGAAPRSSWRPRTTRASGRRRRHWTARWRCCAAGSTSSAWPSRPCSARASAGSSSSCPACYDPAEAVEVIGRTAQLTFHPVLGAGRPGRAAQAPADGDGAGAGRRGRAAGAARPGRPGRRGGRRRLGRARPPVPGPLARRRSSSAATASALGRADRRRPPAPAGDPSRRVAIVLDGQVISSPQVDPAVRLRAGHHRRPTVITGDFTDRRGPGPGPADQGRRPAGPGRDGRAAHRRPHPRRGRHQGQRPGRGASARP